MKSHRGGKRGKLVGSFLRERGNFPSQEICVRFEQVLLLAAQDRDFRESLVKDRKRALEEKGIVLSPSETTMLESLHRGSLLATISKLNQPEQKNAAFAKTVAAALTGTVLLTTGACGTSHATGGIDPEFHGGSYVVEPEPDTEEISDDQGDSPAETEEE